MDSSPQPSTQVRRESESYRLQAYFLRPVFGLFKDTPELTRYLFDTLGQHYNIRLTNISFEAGGNFGDVSLRISWPRLAEVRIFLDRVEIESHYLPFLRFQERDLVGDVLTAMAEHVLEMSFRAYSVTQEIHGELVGQSRREFLKRFTPSVPEGLGPPLGTGVVFYFGTEGDHLAASVTLDFSRTVEGGIFVQSVVLYDASRVAAIDLQSVSRSQFESLFSQIGLVG